MEIATFVSEFLGLGNLFSIREIKRDSDNLEAHIYLDYLPNNIPNDVVIHSYYPRTWEHLPFFEYRCFIHCDIPIYYNKISKKKYHAEVPFSREKSRFTLLYEANVMRLMQIHLSPTQVALSLKVYPQRISGIYHYYTQALQTDNFDTCPQRIAFDETSTKKGHNYITTFYDLDTKKIIGIYEGKSSDCVKQFFQDHPYPEAIEEVSMDMSPTFVSGINTYFPQADITFDKWHVIKLLYKKLDELAEKANKFKDAITFVIENIVDFYTLEHKAEAKAKLSFIADFAEDKMGKNPFSKTINRHFDGICNYFSSHITNGILEGINSKIQTIKRIARGFRYTKNFMKMIRFAFL